MAEGLKSGGYDDRAVWRIAAPMMLSNVSIPLLGMVDSAVVGHLDSPIYLGAVAVGATVFSFLFLGMNFLRMGTTGLAAQAHGRGDPDEERTVLGQAVLTALLLALALLALQLPLGRLALDLVGGSEAVRAEAATYFGIRIWAAPVVLVNFSLIGWFIGMQDARSPLYLMLTTNLVNIALDLLFVLVLGWGVAGVAAATVIAETCGTLLGAVLVARHLRARPGRWQRSALLDPARIRSLFAINGNLWVRSLTLMFAFGFLTAMGARQGDLILAANAVLLNFQSFLAYGLDAFAHAAEAFVGRALGARDRAGFEQAFRVCLRWSLRFALVFALAVAVLGIPTIGLITDLPEVRTAAATYLPWLVASPLICHWCFLYDGVYVGATRAREMARHHAHLLLRRLPPSLVAAGPARCGQPRVVGRLHGVHGGPRAYHAPPLAAHAARRARGAECMSRGDSRELGLLAGQQLLGLDDLHYGFWDPDATPSFGAFPAAQARYTEFLLDALREAAPTGARILDVGCGTGALLARLLAEGYRVDGVSPSDRFADQVAARIAAVGAEHHQPTIHRCFLQELPDEVLDGRYDLVLFSESFQYLRMYESFPLIDALLAPEGRVLICDFFKTEAFEDGGEGDGSYGGGRKLHQFRRYLEHAGLAVRREEDITANVAPNMDLLDELLRVRVLPVLGMLDEHLGDRRPWAYGLLRWLFRKRWQRTRFRYFEGHRNRETFSRYKTYRLFVADSAVRVDDAERRERLRASRELMALADDSARRRWLQRAVGAQEDEGRSELLALAQDELGPEHGPHPSSRGEDRDHGS